MNFYCKEFLFLLLFTAILTSFIDLVLTQHNVSKGRKELNPVINFLYQRFPDYGILGFWVFKSLLMVYLCFNFGVYNIEKWVWVFTGLILVQVFLGVFSNIIGVLS